MAAQIEAATETTPKRVMVVDDDVLIRLIVSEAMRDAGLSVIEARSGADAVSYLNSGSPIDLIFSDIQMPGATDGLALSRYVRETYPAIPVILTSGAADPAVIDDPAKFVPKPFEIGNVVALVAQTLGAANKSTA